MSNVFCNNFTFSRFRFTLKALEAIHLSELSAGTFRGAFGIALKNIACIHSQKWRDCKTCLIRQTCSYSYIFDTPVTESGQEVIFPGENAPHPFVIDLQSQDRKAVFEQGEKINISFVLIGKGIDYLPYLVYAFERLGKTGLGKNRGKFELIQVTDNKKLYDSESKSLSSNLQKFKWDDFNDNQNLTNIEINFQTPTRLKGEGKLLTSVDFKFLITNLLRRISVLCFYHCGCQLQGDIHKMIDQAEKIQTLHSNLSWEEHQRFSGRQKVQMTLGGIVGSIQFGGNLNEFLPILRIGEYIHVGKSTSFGFGKYEIITL